MNLSNLKFLTDLSNFSSEDEAKKFLLEHYKEIFGKKSLHELTQISDGEEIRRKQQLKIDNVIKRLYCRKKDNTNHLVHPSAGNIKEHLRNIRPVPPDMSWMNDDIKCYEKLMELFSINPFQRTKENNVLCLKILKVLLPDNRLFTMRDNLLNKCHTSFIKEIIETNTAIHGCQTLYLILDGSIEVRSDDVAYLPWNDQWIRNEIFLKKGDLFGTCSPKFSEDTNLFVGKTVGTCTVLRLGSRSYQYISNDIEGKIRNKKLECLRNCYEYFDELSPTMVDELSNNLEFMKLKKNDIICEEGEGPSYMVFLINGNIDIYKQLFPQTTTRTSFEKEYTNPPPPSASDNLLVESTPIVEMSNLMNISSQLPDIVEEDEEQMENNSRINSRHSYKSLPPIHNINLEEEEHHTKKLMEIVNSTEMLSSFNNFSGNQRILLKTVDKPMALCGRCVIKKENSLTTMICRTDCEVGYISFNDVHRNFSSTTKMSLVQRQSDNLEKAYDFDYLQEIFLKQKIEKEWSKIKHSIVAHLV
ncbi:hypothetical protein SNEBB_007691 [Seison nebaliae]|nr:hypothetical protein SNEBB_007691 [Seison nebaliae]